MMDDHTIVMLWCFDEFAIVHWSLKKRVKMRKDEITFINKYIYFRVISWRMEDTFFF